MSQKQKTSNANQITLQKQPTHIFGSQRQPQPQTSIPDNFLLQQSQSQLSNIEQSFQKQLYQPLQSYTIGKTLGKGNFGKVKLAIHNLTSQYVAIKILQKDLIFENSDIVRISRQLKILKKLRHPFVVQLYQIIQTQKQLYLIMEYAEGGDLFQKIVRQQRIKQKQATKIYSQIALGMQYIHAKGVTHRDLKPQNILMSKDGYIKIADFGLGSMFKPDEKLKSACGSPCYASPQMLNRQQYDPKKVDIWSSGIILYAMVCGYLPFEDQVTSKLYEKIKNTNIKLPSWVSSPCRNLIRGLLTKDPKLRFDMESILSHEMLHQEVTQLRQYIVNKDQTTIDKIEQICQKYSLQQKDKLTSDLNKNRHNNFTTLYYLGVKRLGKQAKQMMQSQQDEQQYLNKQNQKMKKGHEAYQQQQNEYRNNKITNSGNQDIEYNQQQTKINNSVTMFNFEMKAVDYQKSQQMIDEYKEQKQNNNEQRLQKIQEEEDINHNNTNINQKQIQDIQPQAQTIQIQHRQQNQVENIYDIAKQLQQANRQTSSNQNIDEQHSNNMQKINQSYQYVPDQFIVNHNSIMSKHQQQQQLTQINDLALVVGYQKQIGSNMQKQHNKTSLLDRQVDIVHHQVKEDMTQQTTNMNINLVKQSYKLSKEINNQLQELRKLQQQHQLEIQENYQKLYQNIQQQQQKHNQQSIRNTLEFQQQHVQRQQRQHKMYQQQKLQHINEIKNNKQQHIIIAQPLENQLISGEGQQSNKQQLNNTSIQRIIVQNKENIKFQPIINKQSQQSSKLMIQTKQLIQKLKQIQQLSKFNNQHNNISHNNESNNQQLNRSNIFVNDTTNYGLSQLYENKLDMQKSNKQQGQIKQINHINDSNQSSDISKINVLKKIQDKSNYTQQQQKQKQCIKAVDNMNSIVEHGENVHLAVKQCEVIVDHPLIQNDKSIKNDNSLIIKGEVQVQDNNNAITQPLLQQLTNISQPKAINKKQNDLLTKEDKYQHQLQNQFAQQQANSAMEHKLFRQPNYVQLFHEIDPEAEEKKVVDKQKQKEQIAKSSIVQLMINNQSKQEIQIIQLNNNPLNNKQHKAKQPLLSNHRNQQIRLNERSHSKDVPIVFKSNKNKLPATAATNINKTNNHILANKNREKYSYKDNRNKQDQLENTLLSNIGSSKDNIALRKNTKNTKNMAINKNNKSIQQQWNVITAEKIPIKQTFSQQNNKSVHQVIKQTKQTKKINQQSSYDNYDSPTKPQNKYNSNNKSYQKRQISQQLQQNSHNKINQHITQNNQYNKRNLLISRYKNNRNTLDNNNNNKNSKLYQYSSQNQKNQNSLLQNDTIDIPISPVSENKYINSQIINLNDNDGRNIMIKQIDKITQPKLKIQTKVNLTTKITKTINQSKKIKNNMYSKKFSYKVSNQVSKNHNMTFSHSSTNSRQLTFSHSSTNQKQLNRRNSDDKIKINNTVNNNTQMISFYKNKQRNNSQKIISKQLNEQQLNSKYQNDQHLSISITTIEPCLIDPSMIILLTVEQLGYQINQSYKMNDDTSNSLSFLSNIQGSLTLFSYKQLGYSYLTKSNLFSLNNHRLQSSEDSQSPKDSQSYSNNKQSYIESYSSRYHNSKMIQSISLSKHKQISSIQFVRTINSINISD